ncbi:type II secretion system major pseudopilin GspG [Candidatus Uabimicrobium amorphum]|uniref:Type II secretion system core protein G n=1 Tax=Uabimicrobium amorphum TaxID=2596890 RepID=A0A5S9F0Q7_UABAM|nr:type II secretion system major pseudopilin GspG [Candidatus Uabimicrobium amorphum]BBM81756.1 type II secretion system protein G [Candidatus Uabimicrobium amorphum]
MRKTRHTRSQGFSLVEIMVVVVIIGLLAGVVGAGVVRYLKDARITAAKTQMKEFGNVLKLYKMKKGSYPKTLEKLTVPNKSGDTFIDSIPVDPWGNEYEYKKRKGKFEITSFGADGRDGGEGESADIKYSELHKKEEE